MPRKVQSVYYDTNIYADAMRKGENQAPSREVLQLAYQKVVIGIGSDLVRKELRQIQEWSGVDILLRFYDEAVHIEAPSSREVKSIQGRYVSAVRIKPADAHHLALASFQRADVFLSWNREDIVKEKTARAVARINRELGIPAPAILTPPEFLRRAKFSAAGRSLVLD